MALRIKEVSYSIKHNSVQRVYVGVTEGEDGQVEVEGEEEPEAGVKPVDKTAGWSEKLKNARTAGNLSTL